LRALAQDDLGRIFRTEREEGRARRIEILELAEQFQSVPEGVVNI
jgi:hypothetical protein